MKVVHIEAGRHMYGGALQVRYLLQGLKEKNVDNILVCHQGSPLALECQGLAVVHEVHIRGDLDFRWAGAVEEILRDERPDYLHIHSRRGADFWGLRLGRKCGVPVLVTRRVDHPEPAWIANWKYNKSAHHVFAISEGIRELLIGEGVKRHKITTIRSAVDTAVFTPDADSRWFQNEFGFQSGNQVIGVIAQFIARKGHHVLIKVLPALRRQFPDVRILLLGQGKLERELKAAVADAGLDNLVTFAGFRNDLHRIMPNLCLVVHPAFREGLGVSLLQASACGVPVIASRVGGIAEAVLHDRTGLLVTPGSQPELMAAIQYLLASPEIRKRFGEAGREYMLNSFSIDNMASLYLKYYQKLQYAQ